MLDPLGGGLGEGFLAAGEEFVVGKLFDVAADAAGEGAQRSGVTIHFRLGDVGFNDAEPAVHVHSEDVAPSAGEVAHDVAQIDFRHFDFDEKDGFEKAGIRTAEGFFERFFAGDLEGDVLGVDGVHFSVVEVDGDVGDVIAGDDAFFARGLHALFDGGNEDAVDIGAGEGLLELDAAVAFRRSYPHPDFRELSGAAALLFMSVFGF